MKRKFYIAYGSNLNIEQMADRCPTARVVGTTVLDDYQLVFQRVATIVPHPGAKVPVAIWEIDEECEEALDTYEGYPHLYRKENKEVVVNGKKIIAMVYIMNHGFWAYPPSRYLNIIRTGYLHAGFDLRILQEAVLFTGKQIDALALRSYQEEDLCASPSC